MPGHDVLILGGGPAGLAAALFAARRDLSVAVLERGDTVGGLARSETIGGVRVDLGSHRLHPAAAPVVLDTLTGLLGDDLQDRPRNGRILLSGRWLGFPLKGGELLRRMPPRWLFAVARDLPRTLGGRRGAPAGYADHLRSSLGPTAYDTIYGPYALKLWGLPGEEIDVEQARVRVTADNPAAMALRMARTSTTRLRYRVTRDDARPAPRGTRFFYPRNGFGQISEALAEAATAAGAEIHLDCEVTAVRPGPEVGLRTGDGRSWSAPRVLSTVPLSALTRLVMPEPPPAVVAAARGLHTRAMVLVYLIHEPHFRGDAHAPRSRTDRPVRWTPFDAHYLPPATTPVTRISEPVNYRDNPGDPRDRSVVCAEIPCSVGDDLWNAHEDRLTEIVTGTLSAHGLPPLSVVGTQVRRVPAVYPVYDVGFARRLSDLEAWVAGLEGVTTFGRAGLFAHDNTHHGMVMARAAADCLGPGGTFDELRWERARESFRSHVVED